MLLSPELRARVEQVSLVSKHRIRASYAGRHSSKRKGESLDFADFRPYVPGDDYRRIDQALYARLGQLVIREFEAEDELSVRVVVDLSASMDLFGKHNSARQLAALVAYLALAAGDRVELFCVPGPHRPLEPGPVGHHLSAWPRLETWLETIPTGGAVPLAPVLRGLVGSSKVRGATVIVSDLLDSEWERALDGLVLGAGGIVIQVLAPEELEPDLIGDLRLVDVETGAETMISTSEDTRRRYREVLEAFVSGVAGRARKAGLDYLLVPSVGDAAERALAALATEGVVR